MKIYNWLVSHFYGVDGVLDEYKEQGLGRIGNVAFIFLSVYSFLSSLIGMILALNFGTGVLLWLIWLDLLVLSVALIVVLRVVMNRNLDQAYVSDKIASKKVAFNRALRGGMIGSFAFLLVVPITTSWGDIASLRFGQIFSWRALLTWLVISLLLTGLMYGVFRYPVPGQTPGYPKEDDQQD
ncbi:DUF3278 domain-containing protein [Lactobacillaceae bacterium L1_55_11]|nr:DUF3278 domain-containing protein [Lactobacillaceae bacterium L1_55_11]